MDTPSDSLPAVIETTALAPEGHALLALYDAGQCDVACKVAEGWLAALSPRSRRTYRAAFDAVSAVARGEEPPGSGGASHAWRKQRDAAGLDGDTVTPWLAVAWHTLDVGQASVIRRALWGRIEDEETSVGTINKWLAALRGFLSTAEAHGLMDERTLRRLTRKGGPLATFKAHAAPEPTGRMITSHERRAIMDATRSDRREGAPKGTRDAAVLALLENGLRRHEVVSLRLRDIEDTSDGFMLRVRGKGRKVRKVPVQNGHAVALSRWLSLRGREPGAVVSALSRQGALLDAPRSLTPEAIALILSERARQAGVENVTCHDYRRTYISTLLDAGADLVVVSRLAGHSSPKTTARYDRRGDDALRKAGARMPSSYSDDAAL